MQLSFNLEYLGNCNDAIDYYSAIFEGASINVRPYKEMPMAEMLGITGDRLNMVWQSMLCLNYGHDLLRLEMSDSLLVAMKNSDSKGFPYYPVICILHHDDNDISSLYQKLYGNQFDFESMQNETQPNVYGIQWEFQRSNICGIYYCLTYEGYCSDVISYYENAFNIEAKEVIRYKDLPDVHKISSAGADKIYRAIFQFNHNNHTYSFMLNDSLASAIEGKYGYNPDAPLMYQGLYNPIITLKDKDTAYLSETFTKLMKGGRLNRPMSPSNEGPLCGSLIDQYGICWNLLEADEDK